MSGNKLKSSFVYALGNIVPKALGFILLPIYTRYLSPADYGIINSMQLLVPILTILFSLAMDTSIFRLYHDCKNELEQKALLSTIFWASLIFSLLGLLILYLLANQIENIFIDISFYPFFAYTISTVFVSNLFNIPMKYMQLKGQPFRFVLLSLSQFVTTAALTLWLIIEMDKGPEGFLRARLLSGVILLPFIIVYLFKIINFSFSLRQLKTVLIFSFPLIPVLLSNWVLDFSDRIFIERYFSLTEVGIYSLAYGLASLSFIISTSLDMAYRPAFFEFANMKDEKEGKKRIYYYNSLILGINILFSFFIALFSEELITLFLDPAFKDAFLFLPIILFSNLFVVASGLTARFFEQSKKTGKTMLLYLMAMVLNIVLNFILIPNLGMYGAAFATIISFVFIFFYSYLYAARNTYFVPINWRFIAPLLVTSVFIIIIFQYVLNVSLLYTIMLKSLIVIVILTFGYIKFKTQINSFLAQIKR